MWTARITLDEGKMDVGSVVCIWNEGQPDQFIYQRRIEVDAEQAMDLADDARTAKDLRDARVAREAQLTPIMEGFLNG